MPIRKSESEKLIMSDLFTLSDSKFNGFIMAKNKIISLPRSSHNNLLLSKNTVHSSRNLQPVMINLKKLDTK